ncbi:hypothetical protein OAX78_04240 [Planctomycetota bacterium]|nr:hypothetical protein [Planctomycetota bacterium]
MDDTSEADDEEYGPAPTEPDPRGAAVLTGSAVAAWLVTNMAALFLTKFVVPGYHKTLTELGAELSVWIQIVFEASSIVQQWWILLIPLVCATATPPLAGWRNRGAAVTYALAATGLFTLLVVSVVSLEATVATVR